MDKVPFGISLVAGTAVLRGMQLLYNNAGRFDRRFSFLDKNTQDWTALAAEGKLRRAYGREDELTQLKALFASHGIVVVVGEPGTGKTVLIEEAAFSYTEGRILKLQCEEVFKTKGILGLVQEAWRGGAQEAVGKILNDLEHELMQEKQKTGRKPILFIDEFENLLRVHPGIFNDFLDRLDRSTVIVGVTTNRNIIDYWRNGQLTPSNFPEGLKRRIHIMSLEELSPEKTIDILKQDRSRLEILSCGRKIEDSAIEKASLLAPNYKKEGRYPHHAIELLEGAISYAKQRDIDRVSEKEVLAYLSIVNSSNPEELDTIARSKKQDAEEFKNFETIHFPLIEPREDIDPRLTENVNQIEDFFSVPSKKQTLILSSSSKSAMKEALQSFSFSSKRKIFSCSLKALSEIANQKNWTLPKLKSTLAKFRTKSDILFIEDGHLFFPSQDGQSVREDPQPYKGRLTDQLSEGLERMGIGVQPIADALGRAIGTYLPGKDTRSSTVLQPEPSRQNAILRGNAIAKIIDALRENELAFILSVPPHITEQFDRQQKTISIVSFDFFDQKEWLIRKTGTPENLVSKVLFVIFSLRLANLDHTHPLDAAYDILSKASSFEKAVLISKISSIFPSARKTEIQAAWDQEDVLNHDLFIQRADGGACDNRALNICLTTFLSSPEPVLRLEGSLDHYCRLWIEKQISSFFKDRNRIFRIVDFDGLKNLPCDLKEAQFKKKLLLISQNEQEFLPILAFREEDLNLPFAAGAFRDLASKGWKLICFSPQAEISEPLPLESEKSGFLSQAASAIQTLLPPPSTEKTEPSKALEELNLPLLVHKLPSFSLKNLDSFISSVLSPNNPHKSNLCRIYRAFYEDFRLNPEKLGKALLQDETYFSQIPDASLAEYIADKYGVDKQRVLYVLDPNSVSWGYWLNRSLGKAFSRGTATLIMPLAWAAKYLSTLSFAAVTLGAARSILLRLFKL